ncbi:nuclease [Novosphingobium fuchskuhlense]|uniref:Nuclease n=1 Tax=Novosphingobium fuchskuhlense TaxID=1117702 RepID=A0A117UX99_9SPHN|nr:thermonuclease family protein [Novosphingobium fuchskuhlense]KUR72539.1 nuclease [Novosphingobium fuchskuhlense]
MTHKPHALPLAVLAALVPGSLALPAWGAASPAPSDREAAIFSRCEGPARVTCVVDGDTFWYRGLKIRIADINAPELGHPSCASEARLAEAATRRLTDLLNAGPFTLAIDGRETDRYGRALRVVRRGGRSLGEVLEREGLAEHWHGRRGDWCAV